MNSLLVSFLSPSIILVALLLATVILFGILLFYGAPEPSNRRFSWELLRRLSYVSTGLWLCMGDFNEILSTEDKLGRTFRNEAAMEAFHHSLDNCGLQPIDYNGPKLTWDSKHYNSTHVQERLDWAMINTEWQDLFQSSSLSHLGSYESDHRALLSNLELAKSPLEHIRSRFHFESLWAEEEDCTTIITEAWTSQSHEDTLSNVCANLSLCAHRLQEWNSPHFRSHPRQISQVHRKINRLAANEDIRRSHPQISKLERTLDALLYKAEKYLHQRSRVQWMEAGDNDTKFFHPRASTRRKLNSLNGKWYFQHEWRIENFS
ncbi:Endonuclease/exonuclease/phosphatase [Parasponia andersonii]|uniref:Endonuclease/exonuclease/phosphatase n=1 Tax=Parasponia andersonii TaxID=3476 RepID=A0A2P5BAJ8_PARAD|nr:Endonuclease/exonuclease/phosphatase [Parasponia andersonii]